MFPPIFLLKLLRFLLHDFYHVLIFLLTDAKTLTIDEAIGNILLETHSFARKSTIPGT